MDTKTSRLAARYLAALQVHLNEGTAVSLAAADKLGRQALRLGLEAPDLAQMHLTALVALVSPERPPIDGEVVRAGSFLCQAIAPHATATRAVHQDNRNVKQANAKLRAHAVDVTAVKQKLRQETAKRQAAEAALKESQQHHKQLLKQSHDMQTRLRHLSHQILWAQEEERKQISRELHDEISQILTGINVRLAALKIEATANTGDLKRGIVSTQRLVEKSVAVVHQFARDLRPAMLDDLGLVPTLLALMKDFRKRTGLQIRYSAMTAGKIEELDNAKRTVLYRVAQEALTNVAKHAHASEVHVSIRKEGNAVCMEISDNGKSFDTDAPLGGRRRRGLGIVGMRERAEMVGGTFAIESVPGQGTTVRVQIPLRNGVKK